MDPASPAPAPQVDQVFASESQRRRHALRIGVLAGSLLLAAWLAALALGALGGFGSLPAVKLPGAADNDHAASTTPAVTSDHAASTDVAPAPEASGGPGEQTDQASPAPQAQPSKPAATVRPPSPAGGAVSTPAPSTGGGTTKVTGKPADTPGNGPVNGGSGKALGHTK